MVTGVRIPLLRDCTSTVVEHSLDILQEVCTNYQNVVRLIVLGILFYVNQKSQFYLNLLGQLLLNQCPGLQSAYSIFFFHNVY